MSPLARLLLTVACAAVLRATLICAQCGDQFQSEHCNTLTIGETNSFKYSPSRINTLPTRFILGGHISIPQGLTDDDIYLTGQKVTVCVDDGLPPRVYAPHHGFSPLLIPGLRDDQEMIMDVVQYYSYVFEG